MNKKDAETPAPGYAGILATGYCSKTLSILHAKLSNIIVLDAMPTAFTFTKHVVRFTIVGITRKRVWAYLKQFTLDRFFFNLIVFVLTKVSNDCLVF